MGEASAHYKAKYGDWAGRPEGFAPDYSRCCEEVRSHDGWRSYQCSRSRGHGPGKAYCKQHDPEAVKARREKADAESRDRFRADMIRTYGHTFLMALRNIADGHNDPRALAKEVVDNFDARHPARASRQGDRDGD